MMIQMNQWQKIAGGAFVSWTSRSLKRNASFMGASFVVFGVLAGMGSKAARAQFVYGATNTGNFGRLDINSGNFNVLSTFNPNTTFISGLAFDRNNANVFAIDDDNVLYQFLTGGGNNTLSPPQLQYNSTLLNNQLLQSIAFDNKTGVLYGLGSDRNTGANATLYRLSVNNANGVTQVGAFGGLGFSTYGGLAIVSNAVGSTGYATQGTNTNNGANGNGPVYQLNLATGTSSLLGGKTMAGFANPVSALAAVQGSLIAVDYTNRTSNTNRIYNVNQTSGLANPLSTYDMNTYGGFLAITEFGALSTPEPGTLGLLGMGLTMAAGGSGMVRRRLRKNKPA